MRLGFAVCVCALTMLLYCFFKQTDETLIIEKLQPQPVPLTRDNLDLLRAVNKANAGIHSFGCKDIQIHIQNVPFRLRASIFYEKEKNFRMLVKSFVGQELDIGSNKKFFWFWSKRMNPPTLYYADYRDIYKTNLKKAFHPLWLMETIGINAVRLEDSNVYRAGHYFIVEESRVSTERVPIIKRTLIDTRTRAICGHYLYDNENNLIASAEVLSFTKKSNRIVPAEMKIIWHEEHISMTWKFSEIELNNAIEPAYWQMPAYKRKLNMGVE